MDKENLIKVYDVLVAFAGAPSRDSDKLSFIQAHEGGKYSCKEYRFQGKFGFGGKYRVDSNKIDYYSEDHTKQLDALRIKINEKLKRAIDNSFNPFEHENMR